MLCKYKKMDKHLLFLKEKSRTISVQLFPVFSLQALYKFERLHRIYLLHPQTRG